MARNPFIKDEQPAKSAELVRVPDDIPRQTPQHYGTLRAIVSSATRIDLQNKSDIDLVRKRTTIRGWQTEAYEYFDAIGEVGFAFTMLGNLTSRCRIYPAVVVDPSEPPTPVTQVDTLPAGMADAITVIMDRLSSSHGGLPGIIRDAAINLSVAGECYLVQTPEKIASKIPETWDIKSVDEVRIDASGNAMVFPNRATSTATAEKLPPTAFLGRIWRPHPRYSDEAYSSMLGVLDPCNEMLLINRTFRATARSRLNAGMLYMPDGLSVSVSVATDNPPMGGPPHDDPTSMPIEINDGYGDDTDDAFEEGLVDHMSTPVTDEESVASVVPLVIRGPADLGEKIKQFKFERSFDPALATRNDRLLERILQGLDVPKDLVTGLANVRYSNAVTIDENLYKAHIEPLIMLICDSLTIIYLRQALISRGYSREEIKNLVLWYDPSEIVTHPDRAQAANDLYDRNEISGKSLRRAHGFSEADAPDYNEVILRSILKRGQIPAELTEAAMRYLSPELFRTMRAQTQQAASGGTGALPPEVESALTGGPPIAPTAPESPGPSPGDPGAGRPAQSTPRPATDTQEPPSPNGTMPPRVEA